MAGDLSGGDELLPHAASALANRAEPAS